jgi:DNA-binding transcriptional MerR regulator
MTERITTAELDAENLHLEATKTGIVVEPQYLRYLRSQGYTIEEITRLKYAHSDDSDTAHLMVEAETYLFPAHDSRLDLAEHQLTIRACDCWAFRQQSPDVSDPGTTPAEYQKCKHLKQFDKAETAKHDDQQADLFDVH